MPPKVDIKKIKKQIAKKRKEKEGKISKKDLKKDLNNKYIPKGVQSSKISGNVIKRSKEEIERRKLFTKLLQNKSSYEELTEDLIKFRNSDKLKNLIRKDFIDKMLTEIPRNLIYKFMKNFISQEENSDIYLKKFLNKYVIYEKEEKIKQDYQLQNEDKNDFDSDSDSDFEVDEELAEELEDLLEDNNEPLIADYEDWKISEKPKRKLTTKLIDTETEEEIEKNKVTIFKDYMKYGDKDCVQWYRNTPWLENRATKIWINPVSVKSNEIFYDKKSSKIINGKIYYEANRNFIGNQCGSYRNKRTQDGENLTFYDKNGEKNQVKVVFEIDNKFILQNENIFNLEKNSYILKAASINKKIKSLLNRTVNLLDDSEKEKLKTVLNNHFESLLKEAKISDEIINNISKPVVNIFFEESIQDSIFNLLKIFSIFLAYFNKDFLNYAKIFYGRLNKNVYTPIVLTSINLTNILPEVYLDPRVKDKDQEILNKYISIVAKQNFDNLSYDFFYKINPEIRKGYNPSPVLLPPDIEMPKGGLLNICKNTLPDTISPYNLYIYKEKQNFYCFDLSNLPENLLLFGDNPDTNELIPENILNEILDLSEYYKKEENAISIAQESETKAKKMDIEIAPNLLEKVIEDILDLEDELGIEGRNLLKELKKYNENLDKNLGENLDKNYSNEEKTLEISKKIDNICEYCNKNIIESNKAFSSVVQDKGGSRLVNFCNSECFENKEKWPRFRKK